MCGCVTRSCVVCSLCRISCPAAGCTLPELAAALHPHHRNGGVCSRTTGAAVPEAYTQRAVQPQDLHAVECWAWHAAGPHPHTQVRGVAQHWLSSDSKLSQMS